MRSYNAFLPTTKVLNRELDRFFNHSVDHTNAQLPAVNVREDKDAYTLEMAAPGMKREDFDITIDKDVLTIRSERKEEHSEQNEDNTYTRREFRYASFKRSFHLDKAIVNDEAIEATYENGILTVQLPKREEMKEKPARKIDIA